MVLQVNTSLILSVFFTLGLFEALHPSDDYVIAVVEDSCLSGP